RRTSPRTEGRAICRSPHGDDGGDSLGSGTGRARLERRKDPHRAAPRHGHPGEWFSSSTQGVISRQRACEVPRYCRCGPRQGILRCGRDWGRKTNRRDLSPEVTPFMDGFRSNGRSLVVAGIWAMFAVVLLPGEWGGAVPAAVSAESAESSATPTPPQGPPIAP